MLLPFIWNTLAKKGTLYGNRKYNNKVGVANPLPLLVAQLQPAQAVVGMRAGQMSDGVPTTTAKQKEL
jgi:adenosine/AMP kinase